MEGLQDDMGEDSMLCTNHPYTNNTPGGICASCLQEKLGKLVSSSFPIAVFPSQSSSSSPSFRSELGTVTNSSLSTHNKPTSSNSHHVIQARKNSNNNNSQANNEYHQYQYYSRRPRIMFLLSQRKKKKKDLGMVGATDHNSIVFKRSKSTTTPRRGMHFMDTDDNGDDLSAQKRGFWSFLYLQKQSANRKTLRDISSNSMAASNFGSISYQNPDNDPASFDRKVSRSRSVGCGSRSFSGDFFERISTGFGDCALRRVESQREDKSKVSAMRNRASGHDERVKCGGIFSGFMIASSSSSSSSSSYWVSSSTTEENNAAASAGRMTAAPSSARQLAHSRSKSWGWALASPMRAFSKPSSSGKRESSNKNVTSNLSAIPSLLAVGS